MRNSRIALGAVVGAVIFALSGMPANAADQAGTNAAAADELGKRTKQPQTSESGGLSDSAVRIMMTYAFSLVKGPDGKPIQVDETNQSALEKYAIPSDSARRVIRAATRSAYAEICELPVDLGEANYNAMVAQEQAVHKWTAEQLQMIDALYLFATSYFTGNARITEETTEGSGDAASAEGGETQEVQAPAPPECPPEQKKKVESAINAYVAAVKAN